jgi:alpha-1,3-mannosyltransferase
VYPAGFLYIFSLFHSLTVKGNKIIIAQYIFAGLSALTLWVVVGGLYSRSRVLRDIGSPGSSLKWVFISGLLLLSKRIHSIYVLRLFNDPVAMLFLYLCMVAMCKNRWATSAILFR